MRQIGNRASCLAEGTRRRRLGGGVQILRHEQRVVPSIGGRRQRSAQRRGQPGRIQCVDRGEPVHVDGSLNRLVGECRADVTERHRRLVEQPAPEEHGGAMRLDLTEDDLQRAAANDDLAATRVHDSERAHRFGELRLVAVARCAGRGHGTSASATRSVCAGPVTGRRGAALGSEPQPASASATTASGRARWCRPRR